VAPVYWAHDVAMRLYPVPDLIICADKYDPFHTTAVDCTIMNPVSCPPFHTTAVDCTIMNPVSCPPFRFSTLTYLYCIEY
jgi:hypothetical protein